MEKSYENGLIEMESVNNKKYNFYLSFVLIVYSIYPLIFTVIDQHFNYGGVLEYKLISDILNLWITAIFLFFIITITLIFRNLNFSLKQIVFLNIIFFLTIIGFINSISLMYPLIILCQYTFLIFSFNYIKYLSTCNLLILLDKITTTKILLLISISLISGFIFKSEFFNTLLQIELPAFILYFYIRNKFTLFKIDKFIFAYFLLYITDIIFVNIFLDIRVQYLPLFLSVYLIFLILIDGKRLTKIIFLVLTLILLYLTVNQNILQDLITDIIQLRIGSFDDRQAVAKSMMYESSFFAFPMGLGSSDKLFNIELYTNYWRQNLDLPPHSGIMIFLYEFGLIGMIIVVMIFRFNSEKFQQKFKKNIYYKKFLKANLIIIFILENLFYIKSVPTSVPLSSDFIIEVLIMYFLFKKYSLHDYRYNFGPPKRNIIA